MPMILVMSGNCSFVTKTRNVEKAGGAVAIIGDGEHDYLAADSVLGDDGSG